MSLPSPPPDTYANGTVIHGRYRVEDVLGIGGFGAVYKCTHLNMDQTIAVKVLKREHITSDEHIRRFEREARAASKLRHPNTISMFDFGEHTDGALFLAMEYLEGETLADRLDTGETLEAKQLVHIMTQVCHSLTEAHESGLVHRDLKPENIMLMSVAGDPNYVKVLDFGIAKVDDEHSAHEERLTEMGMIMGTPTYMSPEQAYGKLLDARSDIYALGVLMYEGLTGRVPFEGDKPMEVLVKHIHNPPTAPTTIAPDLNIPKALEKAVLQCLEKQPDDRPQTTLELADVIAKALTTPDDALLRGRKPEDAERDEAIAETTHVPEVDQQTTTMPIGGATRASSVGPAPTTSRSGAGSGALWIGLGAFAVVAIVALAIALLSMPATDAEPGVAKGSGAAGRSPSGGATPVVVTRAVGAKEETVLSAAAADAATTPPPKAAPTAANNPPNKPAAAPPTATPPPTAAAPVKPLAAAVKKATANPGSETKPGAGTGAARKASSAAKRTKTHANRAKKAAVNGNKKATTAPVTAAAKPDDKTKKTQNRDEFRLGD